MTEPVSGEQPTPFSGRAAFAISQSYYYGVSPGVATIAPMPNGIQPLRECYPPASQSLRSALDGLIVAGVAGGT